jgi:hypothetical protein
VCKLVRRLGPEVIDEITRVLVGGAVRERRSVARAMRVDSTVVEADVRWPSDAALAHDTTRLLARDGAQVAALVGHGALHVRDRSRAASRRLRLIGRTVRRRIGGAGGPRSQVLVWTAETGDLVRCSLREARRLAGQARGSGARGVVAAERLDDLAKPRSRSVSRARRSPTASSRWRTPMPARSVRASTASATSSPLVGRTPPPPTTRLTTQTRREKAEGASELVSER